MKIAVCGMRHGHVKGIIKAAEAHDEFELVAACEAQPEACADIIEAAGVQPKYQSLEQMLDEVAFDVLAICDVFSKRGEQAIAGLRAGKHIIADKPLCTSLDELDQIESLVNEKQLSVIVQLTLRYRDSWHVARQALHDGLIGELATVSITGRHKLSYGTGRPDWFFEEGMHGGTINDLFVHGLDGLEWLTGQRIDEFVAARAWNQQLSQLPHFQDAAQVMLRMDNGAGVLMDASYTAPVGHPEPWVFHFNGSEGDMRVEPSGPVILRRNAEERKELQPQEPVRTNYLEDLLADIRGSSPQILSTLESLRATRIALTAQSMADNASPKSSNLESKAAAGT